LFLYGWNITSKLQLDSANFKREAHIIITYTSIIIIEAAHSVGFQCDRGLISFKFGSLLCIGLLVNNTSVT
jgi:hypothetical protein